MKELFAMIGNYVLKIVNKKMVLTSCWWFQLLDDSNFVSCIRETGKQYL